MTDPVRKIVTEFLELYATRANLVEAMERQPNPKYHTSAILRINQIDERMLALSYEYIRLSPPHSLSIH